MKLENTLTAIGGYHLAKNYQTIVSAPEYPRDIRFLHPGALMALAGERKISLAVNGLPAAKFDFARVMPNDLNHLITQTSGEFQNPQFLNDSFNAENISIIDSEIRGFDSEALQKINYVALDLDRYLKKSPQNLGLFLLTAQGYDPNSKTVTDPKAQRLILLTDLGVIVKANADASQNVFVESITKGQPLLMQKSVF